MGSKPKKFYFVDCDDGEPLRFSTLDALVNSYSVYVRLLTNDYVEVFPARRKSKIRESKESEVDEDGIRGSEKGGRRPKRAASGPSVRMLKYD